MIQSPTVHMVIPYCWPKNWDVVSYTQVDDREIPELDFSPISQRVQQECEIWLRSNEGDLMNQDLSTNWVFPSQIL